jgi:hypothetical protein
MVAMTTMLMSAGDIFTLGSRANLIAVGIALIIIGYLIRQRASRYSITDMAIDAAWRTAKARGHTATELEDKVRQIAGEQSNVLRARLVAGHAARHVWGQLLGTIGFWVIIIGLAALLGAWLRG